MTRRVPPKSAVKARKAALADVPVDRPSARRTAAAKIRARWIAEVASTVFSSRRRNGEALLNAGIKSCTGVAAVLRRHIEILHDSLLELRTVAKVMQHTGVRDSIAHLDGLVFGVMQLTLHSIHELSAVAVTTQKEALDVLAQRLQQDLNEFRQLRSARCVAPPR